MSNDSNKNDRKTDRRNKKGQTTGDSTKQVAGTKGQMVLQPDISSILGVVTALMMDSPTHQHLFLADMKWLVMPPVMHKQFRVYRNNGLPFAFVSWAFLSEEASKRMGKGQYRIRPDEWVGGDQAWIIDVIAPFGGQDEVIKDLKATALKEHTAKMLHFSPDGTGVDVKEL